MRSVAQSLLIILCLATTAGHAQIPYPNPFHHIVVIVQENRTPGDLRGFFNFDQTPRQFHMISAPLDADYFINDTRPAEPPDTD